MAKKIFKIIIEGDEPLLKKINKNSILHQISNLVDAIEILEKGSIYRISIKEGEKIWN